MIDLFRTWLPQIIGYAENLVDGTIQDAWANGNRSRTSQEWRDAQSAAATLTAVAKNAGFSSDDFDPAQ